MSWLWGGGSSSGGSSNRGSKPALSVTGALEQLQTAKAGSEGQRLAITSLQTASTDREEHENIGRGIPLLIKVVAQGTADIEIARAVLDTLYNIIQCVEGSSANYIELVNTETLVEKEEHIQLLLETLNEHDMYVRINGLRVLHSLVTNGKAMHVQSCILSSPTGVGRIMDCVADPREAIRNDAILLLSCLAKDNHDIQKIVAFESAFERLFAIMEDEGLGEGGVVVQDCLRLMTRLVEANASNQTFFRETSCIHKLVRLLVLDASDVWLLTDNKEQSLLLTLDLLSVLVSGSTPNTRANQTMIHSVGLLDKVMHMALGKVHFPRIRSRALRTLGDVIRGHPDNQSHFCAGVLDIDVDGKVVKQPAVTRLLVVALHSNDFAEQLCAVHVFQCYLVENVEGQVSLASTLNPSPTQEVYGSRDPASVGRELLAAFYGWNAAASSTASPSTSSVSHASDGVTVSAEACVCWVAGVILSYIVQDNAMSKEYVLRIPAELPGGAVGGVQHAHNGHGHNDRLHSSRSGDGKDAVDPHHVPTVLDRVVGHLIKCIQHKAHVVVQVAFLRLLSVWFHQCPMAVTRFMEQPTHVPALVEIVITSGVNAHVGGLAALLLSMCYLFDEHESSRSSTKAILSHRIGVDKLLGKLAVVRKSQAFTFAEMDSQHELLSLDGGTQQDKHAKQLQHMLYDYHVTLCFKDVFSAIQADLRPSVYGPRTPMVQRTPSAPSIAGQAHSMSESEQSVLSSYKDVIRKQDGEITKVRARNQELTTQVSDLRAQLDAALADAQEARASASSRVSASSTPTSPSSATAATTTATAAAASPSSTAVAVPKSPSLFGSSALGPFGARTTASDGVSSSPSSSTSALSTSSASPRRQLLFSDDVSGVGLSSSFARDANDGSDADTLGILKKRDQDIRALRKQVKDLQERNLVLVSGASITGDCDAVDAETAQLTKDKQRLQKECDSLTQLLGTKDATIDSLKRQLKQEKDSVAQLKVDMESIAAQQARAAAVDASTAQVEEDGSEVHQLREEKAKLERERDEMYVMLADQEMQYRKVKSQLDALRSGNVEGQ